MTGFLKRDLTNTTKAQLRAMFTPLRAGGEVYDQNYWHRVTLPLAGGGKQVTLFNESNGNGGKNLQITNMEENGKFPEDKDFLIEAIEMIPVGQHATEATRLADLNTLLDVGLVTVLYDNKPVFQEGPLREFVAGTSLIRQDSTTGEAPKQYYILRNPILIPGGKIFRVNIDFPDGAPATTGDIEITARLLGQIIRD